MKPSYNYTLDYGLFERRLNEFDPRMMQLLYPRIYDNLGGYGSPKKVAFDLASILCGTRSRCREYKKVMATASPVDGPIEFLAFAAWSTKGRTMLSKTSFPDGSRIIVKDDCLSWFTRARGTGVDFAAMTGDFSHGTLGDFFTAADADPGINVGTVFEMPVDTDDGAFIKTVPRVILKLLLAMTARPELIEHGFERKPAKVAPNGECVRPAFWTPNIIGRKYRIVTEGGEHLGEHVSPRMHWRRGHYRLQPYGESRSQRRLIWINPTLIAADLARTREQQCG
jgi:hypothetical protein